jgi:VWFA-related protein
MRKIAYFLLLVGLALPADAAHVTVAQLEQALTSAKGRSDGDVARLLSDMELTQRLSTARLTYWQQQFPGNKARQSLLVLADASGFLNLPAEAEPPTPDLATQRKIMSLVADYVAETIHKLPNFFARQIATHFEDQPMRTSTATSAIAIYQPLHPAGAPTVSNVLYRDGREVVDPGPVKAGKSNVPAAHLKTQGVFGPILHIVLIDAAQNKLAWSHWDQSDAGRLAVFGYSVPQEKSRYYVTYCCVPDPNDLANPRKEFRQITGYHGEIAVEPATGIIRRITVQADLKTTDPLSKADMLVEYGPVDIGGLTYTCPTKSVSISRALVDTTRGIAAAAGSESSSLRAPVWQSYLNDVQFQDYHLFRATSQIVPVEKASTAGGKTETTEAAAANKEQSQPTTDVAVAEGASSPTAPPPPPPPAVVEPPEYSLAAIDKPPFTTSSPAGYVIKTTARLVDVGFVAYDKHGKPVTDLRQDDITVFDNGVLQQVRVFYQAAPATPSVNLAATPAPAPVMPDTFTNQPVAVSASAASPIAPSATVLLIDAAHLPWADLRLARDATIQFLNKLNPAQPVAVYTMDDIGFHVLAEMTEDHALLATKLKAWTPSAATVSNAQEAQDRNTRHIDTVQNPSDLQTVNGNRNASADTADPNALGGATMPLDPQLRDFGANPGRESLRVLIAIARHLAPLPGHKSLIWVSGDAAMADFGDQVSLTGPEKNQSKYLNEISNSAGEALNQAHVALYALDVSAIEAGGVDASLYGMAVSVKPTTPVSVAGSGASSMSATPTSGHMGAVPGNARASEQMQNDMHGIQEPIRRVAESTGGKAMRRASDIGNTLDTILRDTQATYMASFTPNSAPDGTFHKITLKVPGRKGITLRYRSGYYFDKESADPKARFQQAVWQPVDLKDIGLIAKVVSQSPAKVQLKIDLKDVTMDTQEDRRTGTIDVYLIQREEYGGRANSSGESVKFDLKPATYASMLADGFAYQRSFNLMPKVGSIRLIVFDENSGRTGSVTIPAAAVQP